jgi:hypothetical protein
VVSHPPVMFVCLERRSIISIFLGLSLSSFSHDIMPNEGIISDLYLSDLEKLCSVMDHFLLHLHVSSMNSL